MVYSISDEKSFKNMLKWMRSIEENATSDVVKIILGNMCDNNINRKVCILITPLHLIKERQDGHL